MTDNESQPPNGVQETETGSTSGGSVRHDGRASYLRLLETGELLSRVEALEALLSSCTVCPLDCGNNRLQNELARCYSGHLPIVSSYTAHFGEEPALVGSNGAGNIFFGNCNLRCVYCQNYQISQTHRQQIKNEVTHERLADIMLELQARGCHNINFVSPTHFAPQMARAVYLAAERGLHLPIVYNTNAYDSVEVLRLLEGIVDVYLPDLKYAEDEAGYEYSKVRGYAEHARRALVEMHRQTGDRLVFGADGLLKRGLVVRLLVLPNDLAGVRESLEWIKDALSPRVAVSLMAQYYATNRAATDERYTLLSRRITESEWLRALSALGELEMEEGWMQEYDGAAHYYRPDFTDRDVPFKDVRDFQS
ncbi:MAG: putative pyruvate formate lyase activating enzyme [Blastocatellia bacterium]|jgi:putative pyruvate formate lyase activating enzyme|nr:putative pyruvate formate lyase activating enzyme [Blastocatellia bacterium]